ncbi:MAG: hypothetical protein K0R15_2945 [Clostridiales bacterium]|nr:hypothetical protein [Clostridiales bacterium]
MKKLISIILCVVFTLSLGQVSRVEAATKPFKIELNGKIMEYINPTINVMITGKPINTGDMPALAIDNRTLLPARELK